MEMRDGERLPVGPPRGAIDRLCPDAALPVEYPNKVQQIAVRRPAWLVLMLSAAGKRNPFADVGPASRSGARKIFDMSQRSGAPCDPENAASPVDCLRARDRT